jgi:hypothetical protein
MPVSCILMSGDTWSLIYLFRKRGLLIGSNHVYVEVLTACLNRVKLMSRTNHDDERMYDDSP